MGFTDTTDAYMTRGQCMLRCLPMQCKVVPACRLLPLRILVNGTMRNETVPVYLFYPHLSKSETRTVIPTLGKEGRNTIQRASA